MDTRSHAPPDRDARLRRMGFRAWHRGTREADYMIGGYFDRDSSDWNEDQLVWFEELLEHDDVDIMAWAIGTLPVPEELDGPMMARMQKLDYIDIPR